MRYHLIILSLVLALSIPLIHLIFEDYWSDWIFYLMVLGASAFFNGTVLYIVHKNLRNLFYYYFYIIMILLSVCWMLVYHILAQSTDNPYGGFNLPYDLYGLKFYVVWMIPGLTTILLYPLLRVFSQMVEKSKMVKVEEAGFKTKSVVFVFFLFNVIYFFGNLNVDIPIVSYVGRVGHSTSMLFLFWIGYWNRRLGLLFYLTLGIVVTIAVFELLTGSRYGPILTAVLLSLGYYFSASSSTKWKLRLLALIMLPFGIMVAGYLERIRLLIGRGGMEDLSIERVERIAVALDKIDKAEKILGRKESTFVSGIARNINWVDVAVISTTGHKVHYRGNRNWDTELKSIFSLALFSGGSGKEAINEARLDKNSMELGTAPARRYGFTVNEKTSVEWSLLSDSYSRGGPLMYMIYLILFLLIFSIVEVTIKLVNRNQAEQKLLICVFLDILIKANALPFYEAIRGILFGAIFYFIILLVLRFYNRIKVI